MQALVDFLKTTGYRSEAVTTCVQPFKSRPWLLHNTHNRLSTQAALLAASRDRDAAQTALSEAKVRQEETAEVGHTPYALL